MPEVRAPATFSRFGPEPGVHRRAGSVGGHVRRQVQHDDAPLHGSGPNLENVAGARTSGTAQGSLLIEYHSAPARF